MASWTLVACANEHFFPRARSLFAGLDEARVPASAHQALLKAKVDFQLARHGKAPQYAHYTQTLPYSNSKVFEGQGYRVILTDRKVDYYREVGPDITLDSTITGGRPYHYDEIDHWD